MATVKIDEYNSTITVGIRDMAKEIADKIEIESNEIRKYTKKQIAISRWKSKSKR